MSVQAGVFVLKNDQSIVPMQPAEFAAEEKFQDLIARFPMLLVGDQIDPANPRRWVLVKREQAIGLDEAGGARWSIDHVFLDQDGIPTLVEIKRQSDTRIRREVVGQMLDYAANCTTFWTPGSLRWSFEQTCAAGGRTSEDVLGELLGTEADPEAFWLQVDRNLVDGHIRLLFVADVVPIELRRIVEFLNRQMNPAEVLAIELRQFEGQGLRTIVPMVLGHLEKVSARSSPSGSRPLWDETRFLERIEDGKSRIEALLARSIIEAMRQSGDAIRFGTGVVTGSMHAVYRFNGIGLKPAYFYTDGRLELNFGNLVGKPVFGDIDARRGMARMFGSVDGVYPSAWNLEGYPTVPLAVIAADPNGEAKVRAAFDWFGRVVRGEASPVED